MRRAYNTSTYADDALDYPLDADESLVGMDAVDAPPQREPRAKRPRGRVGVAPRRRARRRSGWLRALGVALTLLAIIAATAATLDWALTSPYWRVRHIAVVGTRDAAVMAAIRALPLAGCDIFRCDLARDARLIAASPVGPLLTRVGVARAYPDELVVTVALRRPALLWRADGQTWVVASDGAVLGPVDAAGALAIDPALSLAGLPTVDVQSDDQANGQANAAQGRSLKPGDDLGQTVIAMADQLRLPLIARLLGVAPSDVTLTYDGGADGQGFVSTAPGAPQTPTIIFGGPDAAAAMAADLAPQPSQSVSSPGYGSQTGASTEGGLAAPSGEPPDVATVTRGARLQLEALASVLALLAQNGQSATLIDLRWGAHPYYVVA